MLLQSRTVQEGVVLPGLTHTRMSWQSRRRSGGWWASGRALRQGDKGKDRRLLVGLKAVNGVLMLGLTASIMFSVLQLLLKREPALSGRRH